MSPPAMPSGCRVAVARLPSDPAFQVWAEATLQPCEAALAFRVRHPERRCQWLAARVVAKRLAACGGPEGGVESGSSPALMDLADGSAGDQPQRWTVARSEGGAPELHEDGAPSSASLSLAHAGDLVAAAISSCPVGVDVERVAAGLHGWSARAFPHAESTWVASAPHGRAPLLATVLWSVKECLLKTGACGPVAVVRIASLEVRPLVAAEDLFRLLSLGTGWVSFPIDPPALRAAGARAFVQLIEGMVLAVVALDGQWENRR